MKIYLAGTLTGNNSYIYKKFSNDMKIYLATPGTMRSYDKKAKELNNIYVLESFYYIDDWMKNLIKGKVFKGFLLDSGAFTFMTGVGGKVDWEEYTDRYVKFINDYDIDLFFELDIDSVVGLKKVEELRKRLEKKTGKKCIPVFHKSRGKDYFLKMIREYKYVAIGGIVTKEFSKKDHQYFNWFINEAHKQKCKIHGLGYTNLNGLKKYHFDSVDSTAWLYGNRGGYLYKFNGTTLEKIDNHTNLRVKGKEVALHNFQEWIKFQKYAEYYL